LIYTVGSNKCSFHIRPKHNFLKKKKKEWGVKKKKKKKKKGRKGDFMREKRRKKRIFQKECIFLKFENKVV
jgi:hypothetical protein